MNYIRKYALTHLKFWWLYIISIFSSLFGMFFSVVFVVRLLDSMNVGSRINLIVCSFIAAFIGGLPVLYANFIVAKNNKNKGVIIITILNHLITFIVFYIIMHFSLYWLIIDFRM